MIGQRLSHYTIIEQIGRGGMGVVYRAHDEQLDRDVAIKVLPSGLLADEAARRRFRKEALSLARLNHPNIATVHEFGSENGIDFLVTEFIAGITLDAKLARGPLATSEVLRLGGQIAEGLGEAHRQGIVHRDLKPGNIRLTTDGRVKILDFGLAQIIMPNADQSLATTSTQSQETSGTLPYMSPEQLSGEATDARSDIWAAGAVLYEMSTGKRPFPQTVNALVINAILNHAPEPPSSLNPAIPPALDGIMLKALARNRSQRYQSAGELGVALSGLTAPTSASIPIPGAQPSKERRSKLQPPGWWMLASLAAIAIVIAASLIGLRHRTRQSAAPAPAVSRRRSIAVLGFKNLSGNSEKSWLSTALSEMLTTELSQGDQLRTIPEETVAQMKASLSLPDDESFGEQTLSRIRENLGSDDVVVGSYLSLGNGQLRVDVRLQDAVAGATLTSVSEKGSESEIDDLVNKAGAELRAKLGVGELSEQQSAAVKASLPSNRDAARLYSEGLQRLRVFDSQSARSLLEQATVLEPGFAPAHSALAEAWSALGYDVKAKEQARQALALSANVSREDRLLIEGRAHELLAERQQATESYQALWKFFPDEIDYGIDLIGAQIAGGQPSDAEKTLAELRKLPVSEVDSARLDLTESQIAIAISDFKRAAATAERAVGKGRGIGANLLVAWALQIETEAVERMGQTQKAIELSDQARELYLSAGDRRGAARTLLMGGDVSYDEGQYESAKKQYESALSTFREIGAQKGIRDVTERIGNVLYSEGRVHESKPYYQQTIDYAKKLDDVYDLASSYGNMANVLDGLGDLQGALKMQLLSLEQFNLVHDRRGSSATLVNLGNLYVEMGDFAQARKYFDQAVALTREISYNRGQPYAVSGLGDVLLAQGDLPGAKGKYEQALALCRSFNDEDLSAQLTGALGVVAMYEGRYSDGAKLAGQAADAYMKSNSPSNAAWTNAYVSRNLLATGDAKGAQKAAEQALSLSHQGSSEAPRYEAVMADAKVKARQGKSGEALKELETSLASARKFGYRPYEYQIRLAVAEIEVSNGSSTAGADLAAVEKDAREHGALLVANQAKELQSKTRKTK